MAMELTRRGILAFFKFKCYATEDASRRRKNDLMIRASVNITLVPSNQTYGFIRIILRL